VLLAALLVWTFVMTSIGRACANPIDAFPTRMLALQFAQSVADGRRVLSTSCTEKTITTGQLADVPSLVLSVAFGLAAAGATKRRMRAVLGGAALLSAAGGTLGLWGIATSAYDRLFNGLALWFLALLLSVLPSCYPSWLLSRRRLTAGEGDRDRFACIVLYSLAIEAHRTAVARRYRGHDDSSVDGETASALLEPSAREAVHVRFART
jgi:hypothetical protein